MFVTPKDQRPMNDKLIKKLTPSIRDYGQLVGLNKSDVAKKYGKEQTQLWRRSYNVAPPNGESLKNNINTKYPLKKDFNLIEFSSC